MTTLTLRNPVDGSTVDVDPADADRLKRLTAMGYRSTVLPTKPPAKKAAPRKKQSTPSPANRK